MKYDWAAIRLRYMRGDTPYSISRDLGGRPSKAGIAKRAKLEDWTQANSDTLTTAQNLPIVRRASGSSLGKRTPENLVLILEALSMGATEKVAAGIAGIDPKTLTRWKQEDPKLAMEIHARRSQKAAELIQSIGTAAKKDWKAASWMLERNPATRSEFSKILREKPMPKIFLNIVREDVVIEGQKGHPEPIDYEETQDT
jgi:hypothetical protein